MHALSEAKQNYLYANANWRRVREFVIDDLDDKAQRSQAPLQTLRSHWPRAGILASHWPRAGIGSSLAESPAAWGLQL